VAPLMSLKLSLKIACGVACSILIFALEFALKLSLIKMTFLRFALQYLMSPEIRLRQLSFRRNCRSTKLSFLRLANTMSSLVLTG